jgi:hypothetical protein
VRLISQFWEHDPITAYSFTLVFVLNIYRSRQYQEFFAFDLTCYLGTAGNSH